MAIKFSSYVKTEGARNLSGKLRPSGRFSFAQVFPRKKKVLNNDKFQAKVPTEVRSVQQIDEAYERLLDSGDPCLPQVLVNSQIDAKSIGSSIANNSDIRARRGSKGITASQRDVLCWAANQLERVYTRATMSFLTLTLPELSQGDLAEVQGSWSKIVNDVTKEIKRELERNGLQTAIVGCTELQMERGQHDGRIWPHLHMVFRGRRDGKSKWLVSPVTFRAIWRRVISRVVPGDSYDWEASENVQQVRKSCGGYLAKYISKNESKGAGKIRGRWHPSDWIICSRRLRRLYKTLTVSGFDIARTLAYLCLNWRVGMGYKQPVIISTPAYGDRIIGHWGWLKDEAKFVSPEEWFAIV